MPQSALCSFDNSLDNTSPEDRGLVGCKAGMAINNSSEYEEYVSVEEDEDCVSRSVHVCCDKSVLVLIGLFQ